MYSANVVFGGGGVSPAGTYWTQNEEQTVLTKQKG